MESSLRADEPALEREGSHVHLGGQDLQNVKRTGIASIGSGCIVECSSFNVMHCEQEREDGIEEHTFSTVSEAAPHSGGGNIAKKIYLLTTAFLQLEPAIERSEFQQNSIWSTFANFFSAENSMRSALFALGVQSEFSFQKDLE